MNDCCDAEFTMNEYTLSESDNVIKNYKWLLLFHVDIFQVRSQFPLTYVLRGANC